MAADMRTWPFRRNSYFIRKVAQRISRKHDEGEEGIRARDVKGEKRPADGKARGKGGLRIRRCGVWRGTARRSAGRGHYVHEAAPENLRILEGTRVGRAGAALISALTSRL